MPQKFSIKDVLNAQSLGATGGAATDFEIVELPLDRIKPSEDNFYRIEEIEELAASIEAVGLKHNIVVVEPDGDGYYRINSGERRYRACKLLRDRGIERWATIPSKIERQGSPAEERLSLILANSTARVLSDYEKVKQAEETAKALREIKAEGGAVAGRIRENVAKRLNVSFSQVGRYESITNHLLPEFRAEFKAGRIGITSAYELSTMSVAAQAYAFKQYKETGSIIGPEYQVEHTAAHTNDTAASAPAFVRADYGSGPSFSPPIFEGLDEGLEPTDSEAVYVAPEPEPKAATSTTVSPGGAAENEEPAAPEPIVLSSDSTGGTATVAPKTELTMSLNDVIEIAPKIIKRMNSIGTDGSIELSYDEARCIAFICETWVKLKKF